MGEKGTKDTAYYNLLSALREPGCALCRLGGRAATSYLQALFDEGVNDEEVQERFLASWGFCTTHSEEVERLGHPLGVAILYKRLVSQLRRELPSGGGLESWFGWLRGNGRRPFSPREECPACEQREAATLRYLKLLDSMYNEPHLYEALLSQSPLCLKHLGKALEVLNPPALDIVLARQQESWERLGEALAELIRKHDYRFRDETFGEERDAWQRAIRAMAGERDAL